jgi:adenine-specific DNA-methyltransferase
MATKKTTSKSPKQVETLKHDEASRKNIPTAEFRSVLDKEAQDPLRVAYERRNRDLDPQLVWRGKDERDWSELVVPAPMLFIQEKVHPKVLIDDLVRQSARSKGQASGSQIDLFADFNGVPEGDARTEFYQHDANWSNRMILGDSLQVMASLAEREGLRGQVQCIYLDPPYGIKFNSNFQWSTTSRDVKDGNIGHITREPEQVKAFRDTWRDGIHSYLTYLRDRLTAARDLLSESGSIFVQIGEENCHLARGLLDEVFGQQNFISQIIFSKTASATSEFLSGTYDVLLFYAKDKLNLKYRQPFNLKEVGGVGGSAYKRLLLPDLSSRALRREEALDLSKLPEGARVFRIDNLTSQSVGRDKGEGAASWFPVNYEGREFRPSEKVRWKTNAEGMRRLRVAARLSATDAGLYYVRFFDDFKAFQEDNIWADTGIAGFTSEKRYVVETSPKVVQRCLLMSTDPGDLVLDPTCGSGTTAYIAEQWGRRWITIDTSRVALALARARIMGARYAYYYLADSREGQLKEAEIRRIAPSEAPTRGDLRQGFVYERVPHVTLKSIANNAEIDVIWEKHQEILEPLCKSLNEALEKDWEEWQIPREADPRWPDPAKDLHARWWQGRVVRQRDIDASIARNAEVEYLYDKPYSDPRKIRVAGRFTVESLSPHRVLNVNENDELIDPITQAEGRNGETRDFATMILDNLRIAGVQQAHKEDRIVFTSLTPWPGNFVCAEGRYLEGGPEGGKEKRAAIFIGPEFGTVTRPDLVAAAREAGDADFDVLIACAFNYEAHASEFNKLGRIPVLKARMNADLHMAGDLKSTGKGNLFVIFGEPDIEILPAGAGQVQVRIKGVDVFHPNTGEVRSDGAEGIACWFIDTDYNEESFFVRHAYFLGANDPYKALKTSLKAEIDEEAWATLHSDTSRPFDKPKSGRIAVKVINHLGDEVMKVFRVG